MDKDDLQLVAGMEPLQHCMEVVGIDDKGEVVAYNHMVDNTDDIDQVEEASLDGHNVAFARLHFFFANKSACIWCFWTPFETLVRVEATHGEPLP